MQTEEGQAVFGRRKLIERIHAPYKHRGLDRLTVAGLIKTQAVALRHALANNLMSATGSEPPRRSRSHGTAKEHQAAATTFPYRSG